MRERLGVVRQTYILGARYDCALVVAKLADLSLFVTNMMIRLRGEFVRCSRVQ